MVRILFAGTDNDATDFPKLIEPGKNVNEHNGISRNNTPDEVRDLLLGYYNPKKLQVLNHKFRERKLESFTKNEGESEFSQYLIGNGILTKEELNKILVNSGFNMDIVSSKWLDKNFMKDFVITLRNTPSELGADVENSGMPFKWIKFIQVLSKYFYVTD